MRVGILANLFSRFFCANAVPVAPLGIISFTTLALATVQQCGPNTNPNDKSNTPGASVVIVPVIPARAADHPVTNKDSTNSHLRAQNRWFLVNCRL